MWQHEQLSKQTYTLRVAEMLSSLHSLVYTCLQIELMGQSILDYVDPRDEDEVREALSHRQHGQKTQGPVSEDRVFFLRMKCTLTSKGRNVNLKSATYKVGVIQLYFLPLWHSFCLLVCFCFVLLFWFLFV